VRGALPALPATMADADHRASQFEHAVLDLAETLVLSGRVGERFSGAIVEVRRDDPREGVVVLREPAIEAPLIGTQALPLGESVTVRLVAADTGTRKTRFALG
jgi:exoribonuclease R